MSGVMIDLMPASIRRRALAGRRLRRLVGVGLVTLGVLVAFSTHSQLRRDRLEDALLVAEASAAQALRLEQEANEMGDVRAATESYIEAYDRVALPVRMDAVMSRVVDALPSSATLEHVLLEYEDGRTNQRSTRPSKDVKRRIIGGINGFAASDDDVAGLVQRLEQASLFGEVRLEYTRSREVRGVSAREFQLTFVIELEGSWELEPETIASAGEPRP